MRVLSRIFPDKHPDPDPGDHDTSAGALAIGHASALDVIGQTVDAARQRLAVWDARTEARAPELGEKALADLKAIEEQAAQLHEAVEAELAADAESRAGRVEALLGQARATPGGVDAA
jgi:hypothetical protein